MSTVAAEPPRVHSGRPPAKATPAARKPRTVKPAHGVARLTLTLTINGVGYVVRTLPVDPGSDVSALVRLRKAGGTTYDLSAHPFGHQCTCPDFEFSRRDTANGPCKHIAGAVAVGLLPLAAGARTAAATEPAPASEPTPAAPAPIVSPERQARFQAATAAHVAAAHTPRPARHFGEGL